MENGIRQQHLAQAKAAWTTTLLLNAQGMDLHINQIEHILSKRNKLIRKIELTDEGLGIRTTIEELTDEELNAILAQTGYPQDLLPALTETVIRIIRTSPILEL